MKKLCVLAAAAALAAGLAWAEQAARRPVNRKCPLKPTQGIDPLELFTYNGKLIGFCCSDCTDKFKKNPAAYMAAVKEDAHIPQEPEGYTTAKDALGAGGRSGYLVALYFTDKSAKSQSFLKLLSDPDVEAEVNKTAYAKVEFKKDSEEAVKFGVTAAPTLVLIDATPDEPKVLKTLTGGTKASILKELADNAKKIEKK